MSKPMKRYMILEDGQALDGEVMTFDKLMKAIPFADYDATIVEFDLGELMSSYGTPMTVCTEDVTSQWWDKHGGCNETLYRIEEGKDAPGLALRFYAGDCAAHSERVDYAA